MTLEQRAQQFWPVLVLAAREQKLISRNVLSQITGFYERPEAVLHCIYRYCRQQGLPPLNAIVIDPVTGQPGDECPGVLRDLGAHQARVFLHDWLDHPGPSEEAFRDALAGEEEQERAEAEYEVVPC